MAPGRLARPPTAAQITISMDGTTLTRAGEITPACRAKSAPDKPAKAPASVKATIL